jgi:hypothetical protein
MPIPNMIDSHRPLEARSDRLGSIQFGAHCALPVDGQRDLLLARTIDHAMIFAWSRRFSCSPPSMSAFTARRLSPLAERRSRLMPAC